MPDIQAGIESSLWTLWTSLSGANLVHDVGYIESGLTCSYEMIVIGNEIIAYVHRLMDGFEINTENLALDLIHKIGPGGSYVETQHTLEHFREVWYPNLFDRYNYQAWKDAGAPSVQEKARQTARVAIRDHRPHPLPEEKLAALQEIITRTDV